MTPSIESETNILRINRKWLRPWRELTVLGMMVMVLSWAVPWFRSLTQSTYALSPLIVFIILWGILSTAYVIMRILTILHIKVPIRRGALLVVLLISIMVGLRTLLYTEENVTIDDLITRPILSLRDAADLIPDEFIIIVTVLLIWRRGVALAYEKIEPLAVNRAFQIGIMMFVGFVILNTFVTGENFGRMPHLFLFAGLMAMGTARVDTLSTLRGGRENPFDRRWLAGLIFAVCGAVGIAAWFAAMISGEDTFMSIVPKILIGGILALVFLVTTPLFLLSTYILFKIANVFDPNSFIANNIRNAFENIQRLVANFANVLEQYLAFLEPFTTTLRNLTPLLRALIFGGIVLIVIAGTMLMMNLRIKRRSVGLAEESEILLGKGGLLNLIHRALESQLWNIQTLITNVTDLRRRRLQLAAARIRRIYSQLLELSEDLHHPRPAAQTPLEFLKTLNTLFPASTSELSIITQAYLRVRYAELPETSWEIREVEQAWHKVHQEGELLLRTISDEKNK